MEDELLDIRNHFRRPYPQEVSVSHNRFPACVVCCLLHASGVHMPKGAARLLPLLGCTVGDAAPHAAI